MNILGHVRRTEARITRLSRIALAAALSPIILALLEISSGHQNYWISAGVAIGATATIAACWIRALALTKRADALCDKLKKETE